MPSDTIPDKDSATFPAQTPAELPTDAATSPAGKPGAISAAGRPEASAVTGALAAAPRGLEGIVATTSSICWIDGEAGVLSYRGIDIHELAAHSTFEETTYLLWFGKLPTEVELKDFRQKLNDARAIDWRVIDFLKQIPTRAQPMEVLRTSVSLMGIADPDNELSSHDANVRKSFRLTSQIAMVVAIFDRLRRRKPIVEPDRTLSHAANFLWMLTGERPIDEAVRAFDVALILHADHELNASTFAARVIAATLSDVHSAITGAIGALKGPLHGGANEAVARMLTDIEDSHDDPVTHVRGMLERKEKISGFGHRVYKTEDPRATHLRRLSEELGRAAGNTRWFDMSERIEHFVRAEKKLNANVDFYSASTYTTLGINPDLFTPIFAVSRIAGWAAHVIEQHDNNRLIRPRADYTGPAYPAPYVPMAHR